jgi:hypothetical protein
VQEGLADLWNDSNVANVLFARTERAGWIVRMSDGTFRVQQWTGLSAGFCRIQGTVAVPATGMVVGFVHTHPCSRGETVLNHDLQLVDHLGEPGPEDRRQFAQLGVQFGYGAAGLPGYVVDADGIKRFGPVANPLLEPRSARSGY